MWGHHFYQGIISLVTGFIFKNMLKGTPGFLHCSFKSGAFHVKKRISQNIFMHISLFLVLTSRTCFRFNVF